LSLLSVPENTMTNLQNILDSWRYIEKELSEKSPPILNSLRPAGSRDFFDGFRKTFSVYFPDDLMESYLIHDGQYLHLANNASEPSFLLVIKDLYRLLSLQEIGQECMKLHRGRPLSRIPFAKSIGGDTFYYSIRQETYGQIRHAGDSSPLVFLSFSDFLNFIAIKLKESHSYSEALLSDISLKIKDLTYRIHIKTLDGETRLFLGENQRSVFQAFERIKSKIRSSDKFILMSDYMWDMSETIYLETSLPFEEILGKLAESQRIPEKFLNLFKEAYGGYGWLV
jgi:cell wall assembly regulator SMI1